MTNAAAASRDLALTIPPPEEDDGFTHSGREWVGSRLGGSPSDPPPEEEEISKARGSDWVGARLGGSGEPPEEGQESRGREEWVGVDLGRRGLAAEGRRTIAARGLEKCGMAINAGPDDPPEETELTEARGSDWGGVSLLGGQGDPPEEDGPKTFSRAEDVNATLTEPCLPTQRRRLSVLGYLAACQVR